MIVTCVREREREREERVREEREERVREEIERELRLNKEAVSTVVDFTQTELLIY